MQSGWRFLTGAWLWGPAGFFCLLSAYVLVHFALRLWISPTLTVDDAREAVFSQTLEWGYQPRQPPLYTWLVWAVFRVFGVGLYSLTLVRYALIFVAYVFVYLSARRVLTDCRLATLATFSALLLLPFNWLLHDPLTHTAAALAAGAGTFYALPRLESSGSLRAYLALGLALGLGVLSKFSYALFAGALLVTGLTVEGYRTRLLHPRMLLALAVAVGMALPYAVWFHQRGFPLALMYQSLTTVGRPPTYLAAVAASLYHILRVGLLYLAPLTIVFLLLFPRPALRRDVASASSLRHGQLLERFGLSVIGILIAGAWVVAFGSLRARWMIPVVFLIPLYFFWRLDVVGVQDAPLKRLAIILLAAELGILGALIGNVHRGGRLGWPSGLNAPYGAAASQLGAAGFRRGTIVARRELLAGNLRIGFPGSRVMMASHPHYVPPARHGAGQCLIVWRSGRDEGVPEAIRSAMAGALDAELGGREPVRQVELPFRFARERRLLLRYVLLDRGAGGCR